MSVAPNSPIALPNDKTIPAKMFLLIRGIVINLNIWNSDAPASLADSKYIGFKLAIPVFIELYISGSETIKVVIIPAHQENRTTTLKYSKSSFPIIPLLPKIKMRIYPSTVGEIKREVFIKNSKIGLIRILLFNIQTKKIEKKATRTVEIDAIFKVKIIIFKYIISIPRLLN